MENTRGKIVETTLLQDSKAGKNNENGSRLDHYYSAELSITGFGTPYHSKIRKDPSLPMSVLVKEDSAVVPFIRVGDTVNVKYYDANCNEEPDCLQTTICAIQKSDQGPFRGHYRVGLEILNGENDINHCP